MTTTTDDRASVRRVDHAPRYASFKERFGGADLLAGLFGALAALGTLVFLKAAVAAGEANFAFQIDQVDANGNLVDLDTEGFLIATAAVALAFFVGGWVAGRVARYDGALNGALTAVWMVAAVAGFAALGAWVGQEYNAFAAADLPDWVAQWDVAGVDLDRILVGVAAIVVMLIAGALGGLVGERFHRDADAALTGADGGIVS